MSATLAPQGLNPVSHPSGTLRLIKFTASNFNGSTNNKFYNPATTFYRGMPLTITAAGVLDVAPAVAGSATNTQIYSVFLGAEYAQAGGGYGVAPYFQDGFVPTSADAKVVFTLCVDVQNTVFEIQAVGSIANGAVGGEFNFSSTTGYTTSSGVVISQGDSAQSTCGLNPTEVATGAQGQVRVIGLGTPSGNAWGDANTVVRVQIANGSSFAPKPNLS